MFNMSKPMALLCYDHALSSKPNFRSSTISDIDVVLNSYLQYSKLLRFCSKVTPDDKNQQHLLGYEVDPSQSDKFAISASSVLCEEQDDSIPDKVYHPRLGFPRLMGSVLKRRLNERLITLHEALKEAPALRACLHFSTFGTCNKPACEAAHLDVLTQESYTKRILVHLHIIGLLNHYVEILPGTRDRDWRQR
jgi:hypothetical protein